MAGPGVAELETLLILYILNPLRHHLRAYRFQQYALLAVAPGWYPCFNCPDTTHIFLSPGEIWKYGVTTNGKDRYSMEFYKSMNLEYYPQYSGPLQECLKEEKRKIYYYPLLPETLKRPVKLIRPPGNKKDS